MITHGLIGYLSILMTDGSEMASRGRARRCFVRGERLALLCALALGASACELLDPRDRELYFCPEVPITKNCLDKRDGPWSCESSSECTPMVCDVEGSKTCVECTTAEYGACTRTTPICGVDNMCRGCTAHTECDSRACLPNGACAGSDEVAYVEPSPGGTDSGNCTLELPCATIGKALATGRAYVKLAGTMNEQVTLTNRNVTFLAEPGARLTSVSPGALLRVEGTSQVSIYDLEISGALGTTSGFGIAATSGNPTSVSLTRVKLSDNEGGGLSAIGSTLTVSQSMISGNVGGGISVSKGALTLARSTIFDNAGGGIAVADGVFMIVGNVLFRNGSTTSSFGGIAIRTQQNAGNRLEFNSFNSNNAQNNSVAALQCEAGTFTARNNIISENGTMANQAQVGGTCMHAYSIIRPGTLPSGPGNLAMDPLFQSITTGDLHVKPESPARRAADPSVVLTGIAERDIDGDKRSAPATIGADEIP